MSGTSLVLRDYVRLPTVVAVDRGELHVEDCIHKHKAFDVYMHEIETTHACILRRHTRRMTSERSSNTVDRVIGSMKRCKDDNDHLDDSH